MEVFDSYLQKIENAQHRSRMEEVLRWVQGEFPGLAPRVAWNQPMYTDHGTFIIGFSTAKRHMAVAPERACIQRFSSEILQAGYEHSKELLRIRWEQPVDVSLLGKMIHFNMHEKAECATFWRK